MRFGQSKYYFEMVWKAIKSLLDTTSIHGCRFIADMNRHWIERVFWLILVVLSWYGSAMLIAAQYDAFLNNPISFVVETAYKDWNTNFPSVVVCENDNIDRLEEVANRLWGPEHNYDIEDVLKELTYYKGITYYGAVFCSDENPLPECVRSNLNQFANLIRSDCNQIIQNCSWNGEPFDCCTYFRPMDTELGVCYAINSIQGRDSSPPRLEMVSNRTTGPGMIYFHILVQAKLYILNEEEVPALTALGSDVMNVGPQIFYRRYITIRNIENDAGARLISPLKRKCRYTDENFLDVHRHYSYTACTVQCRKDAQLRLCNCTNFFMPNVPEHTRCNISGITCLSKYFSNWSILKAPWSPRSGLSCDCLPSCTEAEISIVKDFQEFLNQTYGAVRIELATLPNERYRRNVVRGILDLVVSTGGTGGLFLGASILSIVELLYIFFVRPFCDVYTQRSSDPWYRNYGRRCLPDNKFMGNCNQQKIYT